MRIRVVGGPSGGQWIEVADDLAEFEVESPDGKRTRYAKRFWATEYPDWAKGPSEIAYFIPQQMSEKEAADLVMEDPEATKQWVEFGLVATAWWEQPPARPVAPL